MLTPLTRTGVEGLQPVEEIVNVEVRERNLHIGSATYPVANIARINLEVWKPNAEWLKSRYAESVLKRVLTGLIVAAVLIVLFGISFSVSVATLIAALSLGLIVAIFLIIEDTRELKAALKVRYYILVIETTGEPFASLWSRDQKKAEGLKGMIEDAINNPNAKFNVKFETHVGDKFLGDKVLGDKIQTNGPNSPGKVVK